MVYMWKGGALVQGYFYRVCLYFCVFRLTIQIIIAYFNMEYEQIKTRKSNRRNTKNPAIKPMFSFFRYLQGGLLYESQNGNLH